MTYAAARAAHIAAAAAQDGWSRVPRPAGRIVGRLTGTRIEIERRGIFSAYRTIWRIVPNTPNSQAAADAKEKRQNREKFQ